MRKLFCCSLVLLMTFCISAKASVLAYWEFNDSQAGTKTIAGQRIVDSSGNGRDLYAIGDATSVPVFKMGNPLYGNGSAIYLSSGADELWFDAGHLFNDGGMPAGSSIDFAANESFTLEAMVRIPASTSATTICCILQKYGTNGTSPSIYFRFESSTSISFSITDTGSISKTCTIKNLSNCYDGNWHHVAAIRDYGYATMSIYLDYVKVGSVTEPMFSGNFTDPTSRWYIGSMGPTTNTSREFNGALDYIRISNAALASGDFVQPLKTLASNPTPADKAYNIAGPTVALSWTPASGSGIVLNSQVVQVATDPNFDNIIQTFNLNGTATSANLSPVVNSRRYFWRVNAAGTDNGTAFSQIGLPWYFQTNETNSTIIGYWKFDSGVAGTDIDPNSKIVDSSGNGRNLIATSVSTSAVTNYGSPCASFGAGASFTNNKGMLLNLIPGHMFEDGSITGSNPILPGSNGNVTIEAVVKASNGPSGSVGNTIFSLMPLADTESWTGVGKTDQMYFRINDTAGYLTFTITNAGITSSVASTANIYDQWHHVAVVRNTTASTISLYIDGVLDKSAADATVSLGDISPDGYLAVAGFSNYTSTARNFNGSIDFVKVTRAALTPAEFVQSFALPTNPDPANDANNIPLNYTFSWTPITGATITSQTVKVATDQYMQQIVKTVTATGNSVIVTGLENNKRYYWRVDTIGSDSTGAFNREGEIWFFNTPECLLTAADGDLDGDCIINFKDFSIMAGNWLASEIKQ
jgi:hypothetical protein